jgi:uncharacterized protein
MADDLRRRTGLQPPPDSETFRKYGIAHQVSRARSIRKTMVGSGLNRTIQIAVAGLTLVTVFVVALTCWQHSRTYHLTLAAGSRGGESYILSAALKKVVERHYSGIKITVVESGGTVENLQMLQDKRTQLATAQADIAPGPAARIIAVLYDDTFQLLVRKDSSIQDFADLRGRAIGLPQRGGQFRSFLRVAHHFGLRERDFRFVGATDMAADEAFREDKVDAVFRVRALGNPSIEQLVHDRKIRFLPIKQAAAMKIEDPAFQPAVIPEGAYLGSPPVPTQDLSSIVVHRVLLARSSVNDQVIWAIAEVLMERRQELMAEIPAQMTAVRLLLAQTRRPESQQGLGPALHPGASSFYDKDKPSFLLAHADYIGLMLTVALMVGSWIWQLRLWIERSQKNTADEYSNQIIALMSSAQTAESSDTLDEVWRQLLANLTAAVHDLAEDKLSEESFESFRSILEIGLEVTRERRAALSLGATNQRCIVTWSKPPAA